MLKRPIWVWTSCALERNVYKVEPEGLDPRLVTPLRLGQQGSGPAGWQWCVLLEANDEPTELREPVDDPETEDGAIEAEQQLPDVKDDLSNQLEETTWALHRWPAIQRQTPQLTCFCACPLLLG